MKILRGHKDGGPDSKVYAWGIEFKRGLSFLVLRFDKGSREAFHSHAFHAISWVLKGGLEECERRSDPEAFGYTRSWHKFTTYFESWFLPIVTRRSTLHQVRGIMDRNWVFTIRGPWTHQWVEIENGEYQVLTHGRKVINGHAA